jgi:hypothetical protein
VLFRETAYRFHEIGSPDGEKIALKDVAHMYRKLGKARFLEVLREMPENTKKYMESLRI